MISSRTILNKTPILVTGSHRSGSTWIGKIIAASPEVRYVHEPFNINRKTNQPPLKFWFQFVSSDSSIETQNKLLKYLKGFSTSNILIVNKETPFFKNPYSSLKEWRSRVIRRTLIKDPIALFSTEWLYNNIHCKVIICIRHPAAFVASLKVKNWEFPFQHFVLQEDILNGVLSDFKEEIIEASKHKKSILEQGILLWNCLYLIVKKYHEKYLDTWYFITHEKLSENPKKEIKKIFNYLNLNWSKQVDIKITETTAANINTEHNRNTKENIFSWKNRLSRIEIEKIKVETEQIWQYFYTEEDW